MIDSVIVLDFCTCSNTIVLIITSQNEERHSNLQRILIDNPFQHIFSYTLDDFIPSANKFGLIKEYENLLIVLDSSPSQDTVDTIYSYGFLLFTTIPTKDCFYISEDFIIDHLMRWSKLPFMKSPGILPKPLRGTDGQDTFTGITMTKRIPEIIYQTQMSIQNLSPDGHKQYTALATMIRDNDSLIDYTSISGSVLSILFHVKVRRVINCGLTWHSIAWWLAENYQFFTMNTIQQRFASDIIPSDPFFYLKQEALHTAMTLLPDLVVPLIQEVQKRDRLDEEVFCMALLLNLWGNKADLSMSGGKVEKGSIISESSNYLLINDSMLVWNHINYKGLHKLTICADNTGLELSCDLMLIAIFLHYFNDLHIVYIVKSTPVFVSDVTYPDIDPTVHALQTHKQIELQWIGQMIRNAEESGRLEYSSSLFHCSASFGWEMPLIMTEFISSQDLLIGKGDANYRRLVGDLHWPYDTVKEDVFEYMPCPFVLLRTLKSNVSVGISQDLQRQAALFDPQWDCSGKVGIIQYHCPSHCRSDSFLCFN